MLEMDQSGEDDNEMELNFAQGSRGLALSAADIADLTQAYQLTSAQVKEVKRLEKRLETFEVGALQNIKKLHKIEPIDRLLNFFKVVMDWYGQQRNNCKMVFEVDKLE